MAIWKYDDTLIYFQWVGQLWLEHYPSVPAAGRSGRTDGASVREGPADWAHQSGGHCLLLDFYSHLNFLHCHYLSWYTCCWRVENPCSCLRGLGQQQLKQKNLSVSSVFESAWLSCSYFLQQTSSCSALELRRLGSKNSWKVVSPTSEEVGDLNAGYHGVCSNTVLDPDRL